MPLMTEVLCALFTSSFFVLAALIYCYGIEWDE